MRLNNKVAIVTGSSSGIGKAIAEMFIKEGAKVICSDINSPKKDLGEGFIFKKADVSKDREVRKLVELAASKFGTLDILVNNAGIGSLEELSEMSDKTWNKVLAINLNGVFYGVRSASSYMKENKIQGSIINMASILGQIGFRGAGAYCSSKGAVNQLTRTAALELAPYGIRVNSIAPGFIETEMTKGIKKDKKANTAVVAATPLGHMGEPNDIAYATVYLASEEAKFVTGSVLYVDGGWTAQ